MYLQIRGEGSARFSQLTSQPLFVDIDATELERNNIGPLSPSTTTKTTTTTIAADVDADTLHTRAKRKAPTSSLPLDRAIPAAIIIHPANTNQHCNFMYSNLRLRFEYILQDITDDLIDLMDPRLMPGIAGDTRTMRSSASTPSLRSRPGSITPMGRSDGPGGNVRVVVRVRGFLPRGSVYLP